jgi:hypothetical protein
MPNVTRSFCRSTGIARDGHATAGMVGVLCKREQLVVTVPTSASPRR